MLVEPRLFSTYRFREAGQGELVARRQIEVPARIGRDVPPCIPLPKSPARPRGDRLGLIAVVGWSAAAIACSTDPAGTAGVAVAEATPLPVADAALLDLDGDLVPNLTDNCPTIPNPVVAGRQPSVCAQDLVAARSTRVFLQSRTFVPTDGIDPALLNSARPGSRHLLLHVADHSGPVVLTQAQRTQLTNAGVVLHQHIPHHTYLATAPSNRAGLERVAALTFVRGLTALRSEDRLSAALRVRGPWPRDSSGAGQVEIKFHDDVSETSAQAVLLARGIVATLEDEHLYRADLTAAKLTQLVTEDAIELVDDPAGPLVDLGIDAQDVIGGRPLSELYGYDGEGLTIGVVEQTRVDPGEPSFLSDWIPGNYPATVNPPQGDELLDAQHHARQVSSVIAANDVVEGFQGFLPAARILSYQVGAGAVITDERIHKGLPRDARNDHGALAINYSQIDPKCTRAGQYRNLGKHRDKVIEETGIVVVAGSGNFRGSNVDPTDDGCPAGGDLSTLGSPVAKNDIMVGNWCVDAYDGVNCLDAGMIAGDSSAGPAADGRLKPDVIAPGGGILALTIPDGSRSPAEGAFGGTSGAAAVVSGVVGWIGEAFLEAGTPVTAIPPARVKALLVHTALDVDLLGPDYRAGYGLVQPAAAVRLAEEWALYGREGQLFESDLEDTFAFEVSSGTYSYRATLAWTDAKGETSSSLALRNDLELRLISPSGVVYRSWNLSGAYGQTTPAVPCAVDNCDVLNNVEQVSITVAPGGAELEPGTWTAQVRTAELSSEDQDYSLVLTPPCPIVIDRDTVLTGDLECATHPLAPAAVVVKGGVSLDCNLHAVRSTVRTMGSIGIQLEVGARVSRCTVEDFETGIQIGADEIAASGAQVDHNTIVRAGEAGVMIKGNSATVNYNTIGPMGDRIGYGIAVRADTASVADNILIQGYVGAPTGALPSGIHVDDGRTQPAITRNSISGNWNPAIILSNTAVGSSIENAEVRGNELEGIPGTGIKVNGDVVSPDLVHNDVIVYGADDPAISVTASGARRPSYVLIDDNTIEAQSLATQTGVEIRDVDGSSVLNNTIHGVGIGIVEQGVTLSRIESNTIDNPPPSTFRTTYGVSSIDSSGEVSGAALLAHIDLNTIRRVDNGVVVEGPGSHRAQGNTIRARLVGVRFSGASSGPNTNFIVGNVISRDGGSPTGIHVIESPQTAITGNQVNTGMAYGVRVERCTGVVVSGSAITNPQVGIGLTQGIDAQVANNTVAAPSLVGLQLNFDEGAIVEANTVTNNSALGIHYASGSGATIISNSVTSVGAGTGLRLGADPGSAATCGPIAVDYLTVAGNILAGTSLSPQVLCDVDLTTSTITP